MLYLESHRIGLVGFLVPFIVVLCNLYIVGTRWIYSIDGRYDIQQMLHKEDFSIKAQYAIGNLKWIIFAITCLHSLRLYSSTLIKFNQFCCIKTHHLESAHVLLPYLVVTVCKFLGLKIVLCNCERIK